MKTKSFFILVMTFLMNSNAPAQTTTFDIATYTPPKSWKKETKERLVTYTVVDKTKNYYCMLSLRPSITSLGTIEEDFKQEWTSLTKELGALGNPETHSAKDSDGRDVMVASSTFKNNGQDNIILLTTYSGFGKTFSVTALMNSNQYIDEVQKFIEGIDLKKTAAPVTAHNNSNPPAKNNQAPPSKMNASFAAPAGWQQTNYNDAIVFQSPTTLECKDGFSFTITVFNSFPFTGDFKKQATDILNKIYPSENSVDPKTIYSTWGASGLDCITVNYRSNRPHFEAEFFILKSGSELSVFTLQSSATEYYCWCNPLDCIELTKVWKKFKNSIQFKNPPPNTSTNTSTNSPETLVGIWSKKMVTSYSGPIWSTEVMDEFTFKANGYVKRMEMYQPKKEGTFSIKGNQLSVILKGGTTETFVFRIEREPRTNSKYLILTDKNGDEKKLTYRGE